MSRLLSVSLALLALSGCGLFGGEEGGRRPSNRRLAQPGMPRLAPGAIPSGSPRLPAELADAPTLEELPEGTPGTVVLVVLDTVRADHTSLCGYERPTTPMLQALAEKPASSWTCDALSPATWTIPSHATFFTGQPPEAHGMLRKGVRLDDALPTLAEQMAERGYQTMLLSANPVLKGSTGLARGFHTTRVAPGLVSPLLAEGMSRLLRYELAQVDPTRPLFLVVNIFDAHEPYAPVPDGVEWVEPQDAVFFKPADTTEANPYVRYVKGSMSEGEKGPYLQHVVDGYDYSVNMADSSLGQVVRVLERHGFGEHGVRMVVTSDHGENLGDHGLLRHDGPPWQSVARVPFVYFDTTREAALELPSPLSTAITHHLLLHGELPEELPEARSGSLDYNDAVVDPRFEDGVALWPTADTKLMWTETDGMRRYALDEDPGETSPRKPEVDEAQQLEVAKTRLAEAEAAAMEKDVDAKVIRLLEKLGYAD